MKGERRLPFAVQVGTSVPVDLAIRLDDVAEALGVSRSAAMRQALVEWLAVHGQEVES